MGWLQGQGQALPLPELARWKDDIRDQSSCDERYRDQDHLESRLDPDQDPVVH